MRDLTKNTANRLTLGANAISSGLNGASVIGLHFLVTYDTLSLASGDDLLMIGQNGGSSGIRVLCSGNPAKIGASARSVSTDTPQNGNSLTTITTGVTRSVFIVINIGGDLIEVWIEGTLDNTTSGLAWANASYTHGGTTPTNHDALGCGMSGTAPIGTTNQLDGKLGEVAIYAGAESIGSDAIRRLADRVPAYRVRRDLLRHYWPISGDASPEPDFIGGKNATVVGSLPQVSHPAMKHPARLMACLGAA